MSNIRLKGETAREMADHYERLRDYTLGDMYRETTTDNLSTVYKEIRLGNQLLVALIKECSERNSK